MTCRSFSSALAAALSPPPVDVSGALGIAAMPKQQLFPDATEFSVLIRGGAPRIC
jgi:hypothetical protein